jgi:putative ABC transport system permease protein
MTPAIIATAPSVDDRTSGISTTAVQLYGTDFTADKPFGDFTLLNGTHTDATDLRANEVVINDKLAKDINAETGDVLAINFGIPGSAAPGSVFSTHNLTIKYIAQDTGKAQFGLDKNIFLPLSTAQAIVGKPGQIDRVLITNTGSVENGAASSDKVVSAVNQSLVGSAPALQVQPMKQQMLQMAQNTGAQLTDMFVLFGSFAIIAGAMLIVSIFVMLAEERKSELGMARAIGLERRHLMQMFLFEGTSYAVIAAALGSLLGLVTGAGLVYGFNSIMASGSSQYGLNLALHYNPSSLAAAFLVGVILTLVTITLASFWISKLNIIHAIRNTKETHRTQVTGRFVLAGALLAASGIVTYLAASSNTTVKVIAPTIAIFGVGLIGRRWATQERAFSLASVALVSYLIYLSVVTSANIPFGEAQLMFGISGFLMVIAIILVIFFNANLVVGVLTGTLGRVRSLQAMIKSAVAYPLNNRFRTGMTVTMFALVIFVIVMGSIASATFQPAPEKQTGGYDVRAWSVAPIANLTEASLPPAGAATNQSPTPSAAGTGSGALSVTPLNASTMQYYDGLYTTQVNGMKINGQDISYRGPPFDSIYGVDANFTKHAQYTFLDLAAGTSSQATWNTLSDPHKVIVDSSYSYGNQQSVKAGDTISLPTANGTQTFTVAGVLDEYYLHGVFMQKPTMKSLFPRVQGNSLFMIKLTPGTTPLGVTYDLKKGYKAFGMDAAVIRDEVQQLTQQSQAFIQLIDIFLGLGLIIGIASLGTITVRSILERRQQIGMMRAIGFQRSQVTRSLLMEGLFTAVLGALVGVGTGIVLTYGIYLSFAQKNTYQFTVPWLQLAAILAAVFIAAIVCIAIPARNAAKIPPAEAVRYIE